MFGKVGMFHGEQGLPRDLCDELNEEIMNKVPPTDGEIGAGTEGIKETNTRNSILRWVTSETPQLWDKTLNLIMPYVVGTNRTNFGVDISGGCNEIQHTEYQEGQHYTWHMDSDFAPLEVVKSRIAYDRKLSVTIQLTHEDNYDGGDLEIFERELNLPKHLVRQQGTVIIFPSFIQHRVTPVTSGIRHSLVTWIEGTPWR
jgi:PKHD-type hydroxylase|tara:strand:+ start:2542 stop:3141 length:600 start_codon:yes stop_codon:yes gene_type:complete